MTVNNSPEHMAPTPEMMLEAKNNPNGYIFAIRGEFGLNEDVPPHAIALYQISANKNWFFGH